MAFRGGSEVIRYQDVDEFSELRGNQEFTLWLDVGPDDFTPGTIEKVGEKFDLHKLTIEDVLTRDSTPVVDPFDDYLYVLANALPGQFEWGDLETRQLSMVLGENYFLTFHRKSIRAIDQAEEKFLATPDDYFGRGADHMVYRILDNVVENHFPTLERFEDEINRIEDEAITDPDEELFGEITNLRADLIEVQRNTGPQWEMAAKLARAETPFISDERKIYFRDLRDDLARISDLLTNYRDLISGTRDAYMTAVSNRMNEVMQTLTIVATIFIPLTFIAGIYGMNFEVMPELSWDWGYFGTLGFMGLSAVGMLYYFKRKGWF